MTDSLFNDTTPTFQIDDDKDYYKELVGDERKFKTPQDLAKAKMHADMTIENMKRELAELREDYAEARKYNQERARLEDLIDQLSTQQLASSDPTLTNEVKDEPFKPEDLDKLIAAKIAAADSEKTQSANYTKVLAKLEERYGENYGQALKSQSAQMGLEPAFVENLARTSPSAFFKTFGLDTEPQREGFQAPPSSNRRPDTFAPKTEKRTWSFYQKMRKDNPTQYHTAKTQLQMQRDAVELGDEFADGDFYAVR